MHSAWGRVWTKGGFCVILTSCSPESTSRRRISIRPSRRSVYKSPMRQVTLPKWEFTHLVKVFFCTASRSSAKKTKKVSYVTPRSQPTLQAKMPVASKSFCHGNTFTGYNSKHRQKTVNHKDLSPCPEQFISQISYATKPLGSL